MESLVRRTHEQEEEGKSRSQHRPMANAQNAFNVQPQPDPTSTSYLTHDNLISSPYTSFQFSSFRATSPLRTTTKSPNQLVEAESQLLSRTISTDSNSSASSPPTFFPSSNSRSQQQKHQQLSSLRHDTCSPRYDSNSFTFDSSDSEEEEELIGTPRDREGVVSNAKAAQGLIGVVGSYGSTTGEVRECQGGRRMGTPMSRSGSGGMSKSPLGFVQSFGHDLSLVSEEERKPITKVEEEVGLGLGLDLSSSRSSKPAQALSTAETRKSRSIDGASFIPFGLSPHSDEFVFHACPSLRSYALENPVSPPSVQSHQVDDFRDYERQRQVYNTPPHSRDDSHTSSIGYDPTCTIPTSPQDSTTRPSGGPLQKLFLPASLPPPFVPSQPHSSPQSPCEQINDPAYPLSLADTHLVASLHNGRVPTMEQLAPADPVEPGLVVGMINGSMPIVNTGNQGPMIVQAGDWKCGACAFVVRVASPRLILTLLLIIVSLVSIELATSTNLHEMFPLRKRRGKCHHHQFPPSSDSCLSAFSRADSPSSTSHQSRWVNPVSLHPSFCSRIWHSCESSFFLFPFSYLYHRVASRIYSTSSSREREI